VTAASSVNITPLASAAFVVIHVTASSVLAWISIDHVPEPYVVMVFPVI
jgi:hypothetical protein